MEWIEWLVKACGWVVVSVGTVCGVLASVGLLLWLICGGAFLLIKAGWQRTGVWPAYQQFKKSHRPFMVWMRQVLDSGLPTAGGWPLDREAMAEALRTYDPDYVLPPAKVAQEVEIEPGYSEVRHVDASNTETGKAGTK